MTPEVLARHIGGHARKEALDFAQLGTRLVDGMLRRRALIDVVASDKTVEKKYQK